MRAALATGRRQARPLPPPPANDGPAVAQLLQDLAPEPAAKEVSLQGLQVVPSADAVPGLQAVQPPAAVRACPGWHRPAPPTANKQIDDILQHVYVCWTVRKQSSRHITSAAVIPLLI